MEGVYHSFPLLRNDWSYDLPSLSSSLDLAFAPFCTASMVRCCYPTTGVESLGCNDETMVRRITLVISNHIHHQLLQIPPLQL
jgi:hypothetical protein